MIGQAFSQLWQTTGLLGFLSAGGWGNAVMILVGFVLLYLAIAKGFEPLLLIPIGFGCLLANIPFALLQELTQRVLLGNWIYKSSTMLESRRDFSNPNLHWGGSNDRLWSPHRQPQNPPLRGCWSSWYLHCPDWRPRIELYPWNQL